PRDVGLPDQLTEGHPPLLVFHIAKDAAFVDHGHEAVHVGAFAHERPVEPARLVVLTIRVVVAILRAPHLVAHEHHWQSGRQHRHREEVLDLPCSQLLDRGIVRRAFHSAVPASVVVGAVATVLAIRLVVFAVVRHQVVQREAVMTGHEVHARFGFALLVVIDRRAADQSVGKASGHAFFTRKKPPATAPDAPLPSLPAPPDKPPLLTQPGGAPALRDELAPASTGSDSMSQSTGGFAINWPNGSRARIDARSN